MNTLRPLNTIADFLNAYDEGRLKSDDVLDHTERALSHAKLPAAAHCFLHFNEKAPQQAERSIALGLPLGGIAIHIKDNIDVAGQTTTAASLRLQGSEPATHDATVVKRLKSAGAILLGRTNMSEFAYSAIGINPHYGSPVCAADSKIQRISGGSSSGSAVAVALGIGWAGIGTDTGGSIRIPAALNGIVGWKPTQYRIPREGIYPLSPSLDSVGVLTRSVTDTLLLDDMMANSPAQWTERTCKGMRFIVPDAIFLDDLDPHVEAQFESALNAIVKAGGHIEMKPLQTMKALLSLKHNIKLLHAYESWQFHTQRYKNKNNDTKKQPLKPSEQLSFDMLDNQRDNYDNHNINDIKELFKDYDPRVFYRIQLGQSVSDSDYQSLLNDRQMLIHLFKQELSPYDAMLCPTVPVVAPELAPLLPNNENNNNDDLFFKTNTLLLRNTHLFNVTDGCAISLPCHTHGLPVGLMLGHSQLNDGRVLTAARAVEKALKKIK